METGGCRRSTLGGKPLTGTTGLPGGTLRSAELCSGGPAFRHTPQHGQHPQLRTRALASTGASLRERHRCCQGRLVSCKARAVQRGPLAPLATALGPENCLTGAQKNRDTQWLKPSIFNVPNLQKGLTPKKTSLPWHWAIDGRL